MFKIVTVLAICWLSVSQAFDCDPPCPEHSKCVAQDNCDCEYGYRRAFGEFNGLPYCQWQGTTTTTKNPNSNDNAGFHGDYSHGKGLQQQDAENSTTTVNGKPKLPVVMEESQIIIEGKYNKILKEITTKVVTETTMETDAETTTEVNTETNTDIPRTSEATDLTTTTQETNDVLPFNADESDHHHDDVADDFKKFQLNDVNQKENSSNINSLETTTTTTTEDLEVTTIRGIITSTPIPVVKITKHVEQVIYKNTATQTFYTFLGILCPSLAFVFAVAVLFDCVKL